MRIFFRTVLVSRQNWEGGNNISHTSPVSTHTQSTPAPLNLQVFTIYTNLSSIFGIHQSPKWLLKMKYTCPDFILIILLNDYGYERGSKGDSSGQKSWRNADLYILFSYIFCAVFFYTSHGIVLTRVIKRDSICINSSAY